MALALGGVGSEGTVYLGMETPSRDSPRNLVTGGLGLLNSTHNFAEGTKLWVLAENRTQRDYFFCGASAPKSIFGGLVISFSFSTVNCGFTLKPNIIAVRLLGKRRTVTLYSSTALM